MGYCVNCGAPTEGNTPVCSSCASLNSANNNNVYAQQSPFNQANQFNNQSENLNRYDDLTSIVKTRKQRAYWNAMFDSPEISYQQVFKEEEPENDFDLGEYKKKFNIGAFFFTTTWLAFNCNFWGGIIVWFGLLVLSFIPILNLFGFPAGIALMIYCGVKGNEMTWKTRPYRDLDHFKKVQKIWAWAAPIIFFLSMLIGVVLAVAFGTVLSGLH